VSSILDRVAGAPITWGVCEVPGWGGQLTPKRVLHEMKELGLGATELGPEGYLPADASELRSLLGKEDLRLVGGFVPATLYAGDVDDELARVTASADLLAGGGATVLVLAASAATDDYEQSPELDSAEWDRLVGGIDRVEEIASERRLTVALHPHYGTAIERPAHVRRLLDTSGVALCVDTGHLMVGGADPVEVVRWAEGRVRHVHLKDVDASLAERLRGRQLGYHDAVAAGMYRPLGDGDVDVSAVVRTLEESGYEGWYVLEQDTVLPEVPPPGEGPMRDASVSLEFLRRLSAELEGGTPAGQAGWERAAHGAASMSGEEGR